MKRVAFALLCAFLAACSAVKEKKMIAVPPAYLQAQTATLDELLKLLNDRYSAVASLTVSRMEVELTGGSIEVGYLEKYRKAGGYLVAKGPDAIFVNILNPLTNSSVLTMASAARRFQVWIPSRNQFLTGSTEIGVEQENPVYNVRPTHILQGILFEPVLTTASEQFFYLEQEQDAQFKYYVLVTLRSQPGTQVMALERKIWIERSRLEVKRQIYFEEAGPVSVITYGQALAIGDKLVNTQVVIDRPVERYSIRLGFEPKEVSLNREVRPGAFELTPPAGAEVIEVKGKSDR